MLDIKFDQNYFDLINKITLNYFILTFNINLGSIITLSLLSLDFQAKYGDEVDMDRTVGNNTLKLYYDVEKRENFMKSAQAKFWAKNGHPSMELSPDDCRLVSPYLSSTASLSKGFLHQ